MIKTLMSSLFGAAPRAEDQIGRTAIVPAAGRQVIPGIKTKDIPEDKPRFRRTYSSSIARGISIEIEARSALFGRGRSYGGMLRQPNGRFVFFEPDRPADKILDPEILPEIEAICREAIRLDTKWIAESTNRFRDENGDEWVKVGSNGR